MGGLNKRFSNAELETMHHWGSIATTNVFNPNVLAEYTRLMGKIKTELAYRESVVKRHTPKPRTPIQDTTIKRIRERLWAGRSIRQVIADLEPVKVTYRQVWEIRKELKIS